MERTGYLNQGKGLSFTRAAISLMRAKGNKIQALAMCEQRYSHDPRAVEFLKAAVAAGDAPDANWAGPLVQFQPAASEYAEILRKGSIAGKLGGMRMVPFDTRYTNQTGSASVNWVGSGVATPVSKAALETHTMGAAKLSGIVIFTKELADLSAPVAENLVQTDLTKSSIEFLDTQFISPGVSAVANVSPASITSGITPTQSTGATAALIAADLAKMVTTLADNNETDNLYWVMCRSDCARLAAKRDTAGGPAFPGVTVNGGTLLGIPIIASNAVPHTVVSAGSIVVLVNASGLDYADTDLLELSVSGEASIQMDDAPSSSAANQISLFQANLLGVRLTKFANYRRVRDTAVTYLDNVVW